MLSTTTKNFTNAARKPSLPDARTNLLLAALPDEDYGRLLPSLEFVNLSLGEILYDSGDEMPYLYFPITSIVSLLYTMESGSTAEMILTNVFSGFATIRQAVSMTDMLASEPPVAIRIFIAFSGISIS